MPDRTPNPSAERFEDIGRLPESSDNVAIASRKLSAGTPVRFGSGAFEISADILEGHRFAIRRIEKGETLLSWGLPFGRALREIEPGEYICNARILKVLAGRHVEFRLPDKANFEDYRLPFKLEENPFRAGTQVPMHREQRRFLGCLRPGNRGVGTRNYIVLLGTTSRTAGFVRALAERCK